MIYIFTLDGIKVLLRDIPMKSVFPKLEGPMSGNFIFYHIYSVNSLALEAPTDKGGLFKDYFTFTSNLLFLNILSRICIYFLLFVIGWSLSAPPAWIINLFDLPHQSPALPGQSEQQRKQNLKSIIAL